MSTLYVAVNYIGRMDELAIFNRALTVADVEYLCDHPDIEFQSDNR